jgi:hypothetical protein
LSHIPVSAICITFIHLVIKLYTLLYFLNEKFLKKLALFLNEGDKIKVEAIEEDITESIEEAVEEELFFTLSTKEIIEIIQKSDISNAETYSNIVRMCETKGNEAALVLIAVEAKDATLEECVKIVSSLK